MLPENLTVLNIKGMFCMKKMSTVGNTSCNKKEREIEKVDMGFIENEYQLFTTITIQCIFCVLKNYVKMFILTPKT